MSAAGPVGEVCLLATCGNANGNASSVIDRNGQVTSDLHDRLNLPVFTRFKAVGRSGNFPSTVNASLRYVPQTPPVKLRITLQAVNGAERPMLSSADLPPTPTA
jgi:hypothetical protein